MKTLAPLHTDNSCLRVISPAERSRAYIALMWSSRRRPMVRNLIRAHVRRIRQEAS